MDQAEQNCMIRLAISPSPRTIAMGQDYRFTYGQGTVVSEGEDAVLFSYGPVMLHEALTAAELLSKDDLSLRVVNLPWLNRVDNKWLEETIGNCESLFTLDNHSQYGGLGDSLLTALMSTDALRNKRLIKFAIDEYPACGTPREVLAYHQLDGEHLTKRILASIS